MLSLFSCEKRKYIINLSSAEFAQSVAKVNTVWSPDVQNAIISDVQSGNTLIRITKDSSIMHIHTKLLSGYMTFTERRNDVGATS